MCSLFLTVWWVKEKEMELEDTVFASTEDRGEILCWELLQRHCFNCLLLSFDT